VESKGVPGISKSTWSAAAIECLGGKYKQLARLEDASAAYDARRATTSSGPKPASSKRARMVVTSSAGRIGCQKSTSYLLDLRNGSGTVISAAGATGGGRPSRKSSLGAPGQLLTPTAAANCTLGNMSKVRPGFFISIIKLTSRPL
jgi:hypothetical protein